jgi:hypothetical protein
VAVQKHRSGGGHGLEIHGGGWVGLMCGDRLSHQARLDGARSLVHQDLLVEGKGDLPTTIES